MISPPNLPLFLPLQYLAAGGYTSTLDSFEKELESQGRSSSLSPGPPPSTPEGRQAQSELVAAVEAGDFELFYELWESAIPEVARTVDVTCQKLEFYLQVRSPLVDTLAVLA